LKSSKPHDALKGRHSGIFAAIEGTDKRCFGRESAETSKPYFIFYGVVV
jgi:hypothetical protein